MYLDPPPMRMYGWSTREALAERGELIGLVPRFTRNSKGTRGPEALLWKSSCDKIHANTHTILFYASIYITIAVMENAVMTYEQALADAGSAFLLRKKLKSKELHKLSRGAYSKVEHPDPLVLAHVLYPEAVVTMDSALYAHGLTDVIPDEVHLATSRSSTRIARPGYRQYFTEGSLLAPGAVDIAWDGGTARMYNRERMLVEVMRRQASLPLDYYKEVMGFYRKIVDDLDIALVEDYMALFKRNDFMFDILQREVL